MFPGAGSGDPSAAAYAIVGAPLERSTSFYPGARFGPERIRHFAAGFEDYDHRTDQRFSALDVIDRGDLRAWNDAPDYLDFLAGELRDVVAAGAVPLLLGGEHTVSMAGVRACEPSRYVCVDAHLDLRESFDGDPWSHATTVHHVLELVDEVVIVGARTGAPDEWERAGADDRVTIISRGQVDAWLDADSSEVATYLSIDVDGLDPAYAPATGTREPFGLEPADVRRLVTAVAPHAVGFDTVEVTDRDAGETATLAAKLLRIFVFTHAHAHEARHAL